MAFVVATEIQALVKRYGIERIGFFTLTFANHVNGYCGKRKNGFGRSGRTSS